MAMPLFRAFGLGRGEQPRGKGATLMNTVTNDVTETAAELAALRAIRRIMGILTAPADSWHEVSKRAEVALRALEGLRSGSSSTEPEAKT